MKSKNIAIAAILAATLMGGAITAYSQPGPAGDMPEGMREMGGCMGEMPCPGMQGHGMAFTSLSGSISHFREGNVNRRLGLLLGAFGAAGAFCGAHISSGLASATLKPLTGVVLMLSAFLIYLRVFHPANPLFSFRFTSTRGVKFWLLTGMSLCQHITVVEFGKTIAKGTPQEIQSNPDVIKAYLGDENV